MDRVSELIRNHQFDRARVLIDECLEYDLGEKDIAFLTELREKCIIAADRKDRETVSGVIWFIIIVVIIIIVIAANTSK